MKKIHRFISESFAKSAAQFMKYVCYALMVLFVAGLVLSFLGRQTFILHTSTGTYDNAIYAEENHNWASRGLTVSMSDEVRVIAYDGEKIDFRTHIWLSIMYVVNVIPLIICFWFLSRVFHNVSKGRIFTDENASYLLYYGLIQIAVALLVPFITLFIGYIANQFTLDGIFVLTGKNLLNHSIPNVAFIVAAYIIHYGVHLQEEADHTL